MDHRSAVDSRGWGRGHARSTQGADEVGSLAALEPSEPSREPGARLRLAVAGRAALVHPNLLGAWVVGEAEGRLFVAFERCRHPSLAELLAAGPLEPDHCARVLEGAAAGVDALSEQGLVARHLTPERVLVGPGHGCVLMDLGTPPELTRPLPLEWDPDLAFRSPEELRGQQVDVRSSVYSLGVLLFTALTGSPPYEGRASEIYSSHLAGVPPSPSERRSGLSPAIDAVVARAMAGHPAQRYANGAALARALLAAVGADHPRLPRLAVAQTQARPAGNDTAPRRPKMRARSPARPAPVPPTPTWTAARVAASSRAAERRYLAMIAGFLYLARAVRRRGLAARHWFAGAVEPMAIGAASVAARAPGRGGEAVRGLLLRPLALVVAARGAALGHRGAVLLAIGAIVASALAGIVLGRAMDPEAAPSSVTGAGLTVQLPRGWEPATSDAALPAISREISASPPDDPSSRFTAAKLSSQAAADRILEGVQTGGGGRTPVRLGGLHAWRYAGLRPRPALVGTGYLVPTAAGAVLVICRSRKDEAGIRLAECERAATTLVVRGERPARLSSVDLSRQRLIRAIAALRLSRSEGRQRLVAATLPTDQARAAAALQRSHRRAAVSVDGIAALENGRSLGGLSAALRQAAAAYGRLVRAATIGSAFAYRDASRAVVSADEAVNRELARASSA
jgi:hypothetical protein